MLVLLLCMVLCVYCFVMFLLLHKFLMRRMKQAPNKPIPNPISKKTSHTKKATQVPNEKDATSSEQTSH